MSISIKEHHRQYRHPYYLHAPNFTELSSGIRVMHYLCHILNLNGYESYVSSPVTAPYLWTPTLNEGVVRKHFESALKPIVIYPEITRGAPLGFGIPVRWLLAPAGKISGHTDFSDGEITIGYREAFIEDPETPLLTVPTADPHLFSPGLPAAERSGKYFFYNRLLATGGELLPITADAVEISPRQPRSLEQLSEIFKTAEVLYCYEEGSITLEARMCGCPVVFLPNERWLPRLPESNFSKDGIAWGTSAEELAYARATVHNIHRQTLALYEAFQSQLDAFVDLTQNAAAAASMESCYGKRSFNNVLTEKEQRPDAAYQTWLNECSISPERLQQLVSHSAPSPLPSLVILLRVPTGAESLLANTLDSLSSLAPTWQLIVISKIAPPDGLSEIDCIHWIPPNEPLSEKVAKIEADWVLEAPPGTCFDDSLLLALFTVDRSNTYAVFADNDCYDDNNHRHAPRFKPGVNPAALMSADLAGPLCIVREKWLALPARQPSPAPWITTLWTVSRIHGWKTVKHLPHVLFSLPVSARHTPDGLLPALEKELSANAKPPQLQAINTACWSILWQLPSPSPRVEILIRTDGDIGLIERCLSSIAERTDYVTYQVSLLIAHQIDTELDPDLDQWLETYQKTHPATTIWRQGQNEAYHSFINRVATTTNSDYVLLLSDELVVLHEDWLTELVRACQDKEVVAASPRLIQPQTGYIENCGYVLGLQGWRGSAHFHQPRTPTPDDFDWIDTCRDITTLTTTCALIRTDIFRLLGGLNELPPNDPGMNSSYSLCLADLSLRLHSQGHRLLYVPRANVGGSAESNSQRRNSITTFARQTLLDKERFEAFQTLWWPKYANDPYWNRNLSLAENRPKIETDYYADWFQLNEPSQSQTSPPPRILAHVIDNAQADFRITDALGHLKQLQRVNTCVWVQRIDRPARLLTASEITRLSPDVHIVQNYVNNLCLDALDNWHKMPQRPFTVFALDDVVTAIDPSSPFYKNFSPNTRSSLAYALARCDRMVVSTDFLADYYKNFINDIRIVPNRLEMSKWLHLAPRKRLGPKVRIGWAGGTTHQRDLMLLKEVIEQTRDEADWIFFGMCPPEIAPLLSESHPFIPYAEYPAFLANLALDLAVAPLADTVFNRGKSNLRLLELGILGLPVVCTDIDPYHNSPACLVKNSVSTWVSALRERIHDPDAREREGRTMRQWVLQNYLLDNHLDEWLDAHTPG